MLPGGSFSQVLVHTTLDGTIDVQACPAGVDHSRGESSSTATPGSSREGGGEVSSINDCNGRPSSNGSREGSRTPPADSDKEALTNGTSSLSEQKSIAVSHLPPFRLLVLLPSTYPSSSPPLFSLLCPWLSTDLLATLASHLHSLWAEQQGTPVVYTWAAWLASEALQHVGMELTITLTPLVTATPSTAGREDGGARPSSLEDKGKGPALSGASGYGTGAMEGDGACGCSFVCSLLQFQPETSLSVLAQYDRHRERQRFNAALHECGICLRELPGVDFLVSPLCSHFFCQPCLKQFARALVAEGNLGGLKCPDTTCRAAMPYGARLCPPRLPLCCAWDTWYAPATPQITCISPYTVPQCCVNCGHLGILVSAR